jgi:two-component system chemotaxis sensor kinase CheA
MEDLIGEFITETNESLEELDVDLVNLEQNPNDADLLSKIFRLMHTIKGTCGFLGLPRLEKVAHHAENVLGRFRDGDLEVTAEYVTLIFESIDAIKFIVSTIQETGSEPEGDDSDLIARLDVVYESGGAPAETISNEDDEDGLVMAEDAGADIHQIHQEEEEGVAAEHAPAPPEKNPETQKAAPSAAAPKTEAPTTTQSLRVNVDVLENLMTMVSELVLTRNQLLQILRLQDDSEFSGPLQRLNHVVSELQEGVMKTRMQPIGNAWSKLPRIIRDLAMELGKKIDLEMRGQDTELDRQVLELIKDPLTHMVRNSADHGIEDPETRKTAGKKEVGKILLNAYHEGGHIIIEIKDDGKGLSVDKIKAKVLENGLASEEELEAMSSQQINQFIFKAGFSTAEKVTSVSGRGVGMDVVRTNIEKIGGSIELHSEEGKGSTFTIKIPLTLAIVSALIVEAGGERFAIPQLSVRELVMTSATGDHKIEMIRGTPVLRLRDRLLPLVSLPDLLKLKSEEHPVLMQQAEEELQALQSDHAPDNDVAKTEVSSVVQAGGKNQYIIVTQVGPYNFGIIVSRVFDTEEIVVKPVATILKDIELFSGNTILGDGSVIMILDPNGIAKATGEMDASDKVSMEEDAAVGAESAKKTSLLLFRAGDGAPKAVPLSLVARLEHVKYADVEHSAGKMMVQYRGQLMPLVKFNPSIQMEDTPEEEKPVLVFSYHDHSMGIIVDDIIDITEEHVNVQVGGDQPGLMGSAIIEEKATDVVDVAHFLSSVNKNWFKDHGDDPYKKGDNEARARKILLVDDSPFFRNMLTPLLSVAGYEVTSLESPIEALKMCEKGTQFDIIVSDIEMPDMDGFEFAERIKSDSNWQNIPLVALTSHATPEDVNRGIKVGFHKYVAKFDRDTLLNTLSETLSDHTGEVA